MSDLEHEFAWSVSRAEKWEGCKRAVYNAYYLAWRGWESLAEPERKQAYMLKKMTGFAAQVGQVVHGIIKGCFERRARGEDLQTVEQALEFFDAHMRECWQQSSKGIGRKSPGKAIYFSEHHYGDPRINDRAWCGEYMDRGRASLRYFFSKDPLIAELRDSKPESRLAVDEMGSFSLRGNKVYAAPDFAWRDAQLEGAVVLVDWKTGKERPHHGDQVVFYALYAGVKGWITAPEQARGRVFYLKDGRMKAVEIDQAAVDRAKREALASIAEMRKVHFDADAGVGDPGNFPMTENRRTCAYCEFRELCKR